MISQFPSEKDIKTASRRQLCVWTRFLRSGENDEEIRLSNLIFTRLEDLGGFTPEISKSIGWEDHYC